MEKDIAIGNVGSIKLDFIAGKAQMVLSANESILNGAAQASANISVTVDSEALLDLIFAAIEAKSPAGVVLIEELVKTSLKSAVSQIK